MQKALKKHAVTISVYTAALGAFTAFLRWLQNQSAFDKDTGLLNPSALNILLPLFMAGAVVLFYFLIKKVWVSGLDAPLDIHRIMNGTSIFYPIAFYAVSAVTVIGGIASFFGAADYAFPGAFRIIAFLAILSGIGFPLVCICSRKNYAPSVVCILMTVPIVMFCLWLVFSYKVNSSNPTVWAYAIEIITLCVCIIAFYFMAGFSYGRAVPRYAMLISVPAAYMCIVSLADVRAFGLQLVLLGSAGMLLLENWMIVCNMHEPESQPETEETPETAEEVTEDAPEEVNTDKTVIGAGKTEATDEPTIQAPDYKPKLDDAVEDILKEYNENN